MFVDDPEDCDAVVHLAAYEPEERVGKFSLHRGASSQVTTICPECLSRRKETWLKERQLRREEADSFLSQMQIIRESQRLSPTEVTASPPPPPPQQQQQQPIVGYSRDSSTICKRDSTVEVEDGAESITVGPARILVTSRQDEDGHVVAQIHTEFPLQPLPPDSPRNLQFVFDVALPEETTPGA